MENRFRTASALHRLGARTPTGGAIDHDDLRNANTLWSTPHGRVDVLTEATGPDNTTVTYKDIHPHAVTIGGLIQGQTVQIASLTDLIVMKTAANRPKDREALPELNQLAATQPPQLKVEPPSHHPEPPTPAR